MRVAVSLRDQTFEHAASLGILNTSLGLTRALARHRAVDELLVATNRELGEVAGPARAGLRYQGLSARSPQRSARVLWDHWQVADIGAREQLDWLILPKGFPPLLRWPARRVCSYVHDDSVLARGSDLRARVKRGYFGTMLHAALARADVIATNSQFTAARLRQLSARARPIAVVGIGFDAAEAVPRGAGAHLLLLTSRHAHKLTQQAVRWLLAWEDATGNEQPVVGVGDLPSDVHWPERAHWRHVRRPSEPAYRTLFETASVVLYFSAYEGYGMPPREALQRGIWTLASDLPPIREDVPERCLFDNASYSAFADRLSDALAYARAGTPPPGITLPSWNDVGERLVAALQRAG